MANNYKKGADFERALINKLETAGLFAVRTAGSHSIFDVISLDNKKGIITFYQCKTGSRIMNPNEEFKNFRVPKILRARKVWLTHQKYNHKNEEIVYE